MNNFNHLKQMTVEQLSEYLSNRAGCCFCVYGFTECNEAIGCVEGIKQWLLEECENDEIYN